MSVKSQTLRALVQERLSAAAEEIFALFENTIAEFEEELIRKEEENQRKQELLDSVLKKRNQTPNNHTTSSEPGLNQDLNLESPQVKVEPEEQNLKPEQQKDLLLPPEQAQPPGISWMKESRFSYFVPSYGDQIPVRPFHPHNFDRPSTSNATRRPLFERLKHRMNNERDDDGFRKRGWNHCLNNKFAQKKTRKVEVGWIHEARQVRHKRGGGTRTINVPRDTRKAQLLEYAKEQFFPQGQNWTGKFNESTSDIVDFRGDSMIDDNVTVGEMYDIMKKGMLRFYLSTRTTPGQHEEERRTDEEVGEELDWGGYCESGEPQFEDTTHEEQIYYCKREEQNEDSDIAEIKIEDTYQFPRTKMEYQSEEETEETNFAT